MCVQVVISLGQFVRFARRAIAVGISLTSCLGTQIYAFEIVRPPFRLFPLPVWLHCLLRSSSGLLDPQYMSLVAVAIAISYLSSLGADKFAFKVLRPTLTRSSAIGKQTRLFSSVTADRVLCDCSSRTVPDTTLQLVSSLPQPMQVVPGEGAHRSSFGASVSTTRLWLS